MYLTKTQERMLEGEQGRAKKISMEILTGLGDVFEAEKLIPIESAHVSGVSYTTCGEAGLNFVKMLSEEGTKISVPTTINPCGMDLEKWRDFGVPLDFADKQLEILKAFEKMNVKISCTCSPYLMENKPKFGDHLAWAESSAIIYANSVLGSRTNKEGGPSALSSAITGFTPEYGLHLEKNREGTLKVKVEESLLKTGRTFPFSILGYWIGKEFPEKVPVLESINPSTEQHKALGAGLGTSGSRGIYHIPEVTPEAKRNPKICETDETVTFDKSRFEKTLTDFENCEEPDLICLGCPHLTLNELKELSLKKIEFSGEIWAFLSEEMRRVAEKKGLLDNLRDKGVKFVCDSCMVVSPLKEMGYDCIGVNSVKAAKYAPSLANVNVKLDTLDNLVK